MFVLEFTRIRSFGSAFVAFGGCRVVSEVDFGGIFEFKASGLVVCLVSVEELFDDPEIRLDCGTNRAVSSTPNTVVKRGVLIWVSIPNRLIWYCTR